MKFENILNQMKYENSKELEEAKKYIALKGMVQYQRIINYCKSASDEFPSYTKVSGFYRYDKRLRDNLYIYMATVEEFMRACIGNKFDNDDSNLVKTEQFIKKQKKYKSVSFTLEQLTLGELIQLVLKNKMVFQDVYNLETLKINLNAFRVLRNRISHHNFLFAETYEECIINNIIDNTIKHNIANVKFLLPSEYRQGFSKTINECTKDLQINDSIQVMI